VVFPSEIRQMPGLKAAYGTQERESGLSAVSLRTCGPLALIPVNGKKTKSGAKFGPKNSCSTRPWGRRAVILVNGSCLSVDFTCHLTSVLRDSAVCASK
jgi:hypothetical protein